MKSKIMYVACGGFHAVALAETDNMVLSWGRNNYG